MLIFVHVPKTAGSTFKSLISKEFNSKDILVIDSPSWISEELIVNRSNLPGSVTQKPNSNIKFMCGHFKATKALNMYPDATLITWLRNPVERVVSQYYYYLGASYTYGVRTEHRTYDLVTLEDFIKYSSHQNIATSLLDVPLDRFKFIGIKEHFKEELKRFNRVMRFNLNQPTVDYNVNSKKQNINENYSVSEEIRELIRYHNKKDVEMYEECLKKAGYK